MKNNVTLMLLLSFLFSCAHKNQQRIEITSFSHIKWQKLNPARGDKSPLAGPLWGDLKEEVPTAFLAQFLDGFSSPPHIHNVSYRAIVIDGELHNDDPKAAKMWMPQSSYWTQPAGEPHITAARGKRNIALVEIDKGPYLVRPIKQSFDNGERPYNIHASNIIWQKQGDFEKVDLWKDESERVVGSLFRFRGSFAYLASKSNLVVIKGEASVADQKLVAGSVIKVPSPRELNLSCQTSECIIYDKR